MTPETLTPEQEEWARDEGYLYTECCGWVDYDDNRVTIATLYAERTDLTR